MKYLKKIKGEIEFDSIIFMLALAAWLTHVITCIQDDRWGLLIAGGFIFPIGIIHGIGIWFGGW